MSADQELARRRAKMAVTARRVAKHPLDRSVADDLVQQKREYYEVKLRGQIESAVASAPPLTDEQLDRLALIFKTSPRRGFEAVTHVG